MNPGTLILTATGAGGRRIEREARCTFAVGESACGLRPDWFAEWTQPGSVLRRGRWLCDGHADIIAARFATVERR